jgi:membrane protein
MSRGGGVARHGWELLVQTYRLWHADNAPRMAAALTYYVLLSTAPLVVILVGVVGTYLGRSAIAAQVLRHANTLAGRLGEEFVRTLIAAAPGSRAISLAAAVIAFAGTMRFFGELRNALDTMWEVPPLEPPAGTIAQRVTWWLRQEGRSRLASFVMVLALGALLVASVVASAVLRVLAATAPPLIRVSSGISVLEAAVSVLLVTGLFAIVYRVVPRTRIAWRDVLVGAVASALLFVGGRLALGLYFAYADPGSVFGAAGSLVALLVWIDLSVQVALFGAEFTYVWAHEHGSRQGEPAREPLKADAARAARAAAGTRRARKA